MATPFPAPKGGDKNILPPELVEVGLDELTPAQVEKLAGEFRPLDGVSTFVTGEEFVTKVSAFLLEAVGRDTMVKRFIQKQYESGMRRQ